MNLHTMPAEPAIQFANIQCDLGRLLPIDRFLRSNQGQFVRTRARRKHRAMRRISTNTPTPALIKTMVIAQPPAAVWISLAKSGRGQARRDLYTGHQIPDFSGQ